jgi:hypothetical protein
VGARFSAPVQTGPGAHPVSCTMGTGSFPGVKSSRGVMLTPHPLLVPLIMKEYSYTSTPLMGRTSCTEPQCLYKGDLYLIIIGSISTFTYTVWHVDKYKITFKLVISHWINEINLSTHSRILFSSEYLNYKLFIREKCLEN